MLKSILFEQYDNKVDKIYDGGYDLIFPIDLVYLTDEVLLKLNDYAQKLSKIDLENYQKDLLEYKDIAIECILTNCVESNVYTNPKIDILKNRPKTIELINKLYDLINKIREYEIIKPRWTDYKRKILAEIKNRKLNLEL